jgi:PAS domain S-box-containing protein
MRSRDPWRVLLIEDDEDDWVLARSLFATARPGVELAWAKQRDEALSMLAGASYDAVLVDYLLGEHSGVELVRELVHRGLAPPVILLTGHGSHEVDLAAMEAGASEYLVKSEITPALLERTVRYAIEGKRAEEALRRREERYRRLLEGLDQLIYEVEVEDEEGPLVTFVSRRARELYGVEAAELLGPASRWLEWVHAEDREAAAAEQARALRGTPVTRRYRVRPRGSAEWRWIEDRLLPRLDVHGGVVGLLGVARDVHDRVLAAEALHEREEQLRQSQKMEAIGRLAGGIAHDFNNLLTAISGYTELVVMRLPADDPGQADAQEVLRAADRAAALTRQLLAFSRRQVLQPRPVDLNAVVRDAERLLRRLIGEDVAIRLELADGLPAAVVDPGQMDQVLMNLAINARDAMPGGGELRIATRVRLVGSRDEASGDHAVASGAWIELVVEDNGIGMSAEVRERVFEPFFTTKEPGRGTGLGMSTVYGIVEQSGGTITVDSTPGLGTRFTVLLPQAKPT